jgi:four helix bundle protein
MKYTRFEELPVWQAALQLAARTYSLTSQPPFRGQSSLRDQLERAAVSVSNNIAEGFERGTTKELLTFLYIARGSAGEVRSMLSLLEILPNFDNLKSEISNLKSQAENISRQLRGWANALQESPITGQRYLTEKARRVSRARQDREEFLKELERMRASGAKPPANPNPTSGSIPPKD